MAEGGDRRISLHGRQSPFQMLNIGVSTKKEAIGALEEITKKGSDTPKELKQLSEDLLKSLKTSNPDEPLNELEKVDYMAIAQGMNDKHLSERNITVLSQLASGLMKSPFAIELEDKLRDTQSKLREARQKINELEEELSRQRSQQARERLERQKEIEGILEVKARERQRFTEEKRELKMFIDGLEEDKRQLEGKIKKLETQMEEDKCANERYKQEQRDILRKLSENYMKDISALKADVDKLKDENQRLKTHEPYKLVGYGVTLITNALYKHVHEVPNPRKNYYSIDQLENYLQTKYRNNEAGRRSAEQRWKQIKEIIDWNDSLPPLLNQLAENREKGSSHVDYTVEYHEFSEAVRIMYSEKEIDQSEMELIRDLFVKCNDRLPMSETRRN